MKDADHGSWPPVSALISCALATLPKCPVCLMSLAGTFGLGSLPLAASLPILFPVALGLTLTPLARVSIKRRTWAPVVLGVLAVVLLSAASRDLVNRQWIIAAMVALFCASAWNVWPRVGAIRTNCILGHHTAESSASCRARSVAKSTDVVEENL
jgi:hypothetical protein